jgi:nucleotide-binding universal stress UspA family protein
MLVAVHSGPLLPAPPELNYASLRKQSQLVLREARDSLAPGARTVTASDPSVAHALHRIVQRHHRDLLVVGSSRLGPEGRVRIGKRTRQLLKHAASQLDVDVALGRPADALLAFSEHVDLLVIGSPRWGTTARLLLGSTGEALMHDAACPVLAVPRPPG